MIEKYVFLMLSSAALASAPTAVTAQQANPPRPALLEGLLACRSVVATEARLACFDAAAAAFDTAEQQGEVTVIDRVQARETRTRLFGLDLDNANLFGRLRQDDPVEAIETTLTSGRQDGRGQWTFVLADGSTWRQIDQERVTARVGPGVSVRIRQGAVGSYLLSVGGSRSVRARRER
ncbi:hypothetical protein [Brevundimonas sp. NIBR11]|uniref:hypothetical protein n=1 Tax=Brevundimonas sp. NIBR11 TaxID=3015999 RepID=UPI0022F138CA|nr:hypothetical protein [Brevundimonas sp. NIBR11]WGM30146.1 hypothetical protein KKHFBJBL_00362 [Brevundimonas sp. NIBR11]